MMFEEEVPGLVKLVLNSYAISIWESPAMKHQRLENCKQKQLPDFLKGWDEITRNAIQMISKENLPITVYNNLFKELKRIGRDICLWTIHIVIVQGVRPEYSLDIIWTGSGKINEVKLLEKWIIDEKMKMFSPKFLSDLAYRCGHLDYCLLPEFFIEKNETGYFKLNCGYILHSKENCMLLMRNAGNIAADLEKWIHIKGYSRESYCFRIAVRGGCDFAVKHFWNRMNDGERSLHFFSALEDSLHYVRKCLMSGYWDEKRTKIFEFLMGQTDEVGMNNLILTQINSLGFRLWYNTIVYSTNNAFVKSVIKMFPYEHIEIVLDYFLTNLKNCLPTFCIGFYQEFYDRFGNIFPNYDQNKDMLCNEILELFRASAFDFIKTILNFKTGEDLKIACINPSDDSYFLEAVLEKKFYKFDMYMEALHLTETEKNSFKLQILNYYVKRLINYSKRHDDFRPLKGKLDRHFNSMKEKKKKFINEMEASCINADFIAWSNNSVQENEDMVEKFLKWKYGDDPKNDIKTEGFIQRAILNL